MPASWENGVLEAYSTLKLYRACGFCLTCIALLGELSEDAGVQMAACALLTTAVDVWVQGAVEGVEVALSDDGLVSRLSGAPQAWVTTLDSLLHYPLQQPPGAAMERLLSEGLRCVTRSHTPIALASMDPGAFTGLDGTNQSMSMSA